MVAMGNFVMHRTERITGIVLGVDPDNPGHLVVRVWSEPKQEYVNRLFHTTWIVEVETHNGFEEHKRPSESCSESVKEMAIELALQTNDKVWFDEINSKKIYWKAGERI